MFQINIKIVSNTNIKNSPLKSIKNPEEKENNTIKPNDIFLKSLINENRNKFNNKSCNVIEDI